MRAGQAGQVLYILTSFQVLPHLKAGRMVKKTVLKRLFSCFFYFFNVFSCFFMIFHDFWPFKKGLYPLLGVYSAKLVAPKSWSTPRGGLAFPWFLMIFHLFCYYFYQFSMFFHVFWSILLNFVQISTKLGIFWLKILHVFYPLFCPFSSFWSFLPIFKHVLGGGGSSILVFTPLNISPESYCTQKLKWSAQFQ